MKTCSVHTAAGGTALYKQSQYKVIFYTRLVFWTKHCASWVFTEKKYGLVDKAWVRSALYASQLHNLVRCVALDIFP